MDSENLYYCTNMWKSAQNCIDCSMITEGGTLLYECVDLERCYKCQFSVWKHTLPLPRLCPACRFQERIERKPPLRIYERCCECIGLGSAKGGYKNVASHRHGTEPCEVICKTAFSPALQEIIYCEQCYNSEVA